MSSTNPNRFVVAFSNPVSLSGSYDGQSLPFVPRALVRRQSMFANNAQVCYKLHSLGSGGVGHGVRNARRITRRT